MGEPALIQMFHVHKNFGQALALWDVSFRVEAGAFVFVTGPSGAGKSTLISLLAAVERPTQGRILIGSVDLTALKKSKLPWIRRRIGVVFQDFKLLPDLSVFDNVALALEVWGMARSQARKRVEAVLAAVGLETKAKALPQTLSGGEQQRAALARALVSEPMIVLADEPTGNLDWELSQEIIQLLKRFNERGTTVVVASHDRQLIRSVPAGVLTLSRGRVVGVEV
ncbi:MAG: cell division ATP-binding protein FtsE [Deltaproteobacteria bacterium]|nr:cell division ATP-binding protein FtsE [Deltaproteobacteria bacterium]